jgi:hypothetical protein
MGRHKETRFFVYRYIGHAARQGGRNDRQTKKLRLDLNNAEGFRRADAWESQQVRGQQDDPFCPLIDAAQKVNSFPDADTVCKLFEFGAQWALSDDKSVHKHIEAFAAD